MALIFYYLSAVNGVIAYLLSQSSPLAVALVFALLALGFLLLIESLNTLERGGRDGDPPR
ncbi:MAG: hypothetical protein BWZ10_03024 [candidate division BRC1 bacterium ADurb.BinA364]|nr:MAG: hypothetical protein BWZ10_03024 [candidate division BRC1 bacterium ADurb.BinA364]